MIDSHGHLADVRIALIVDELIVELQRLGVTKVIMGGVDPQEWMRQRDLQHKYSTFVETSFGIHPWVIAESDDTELESMFETLSRELATANFAGEIGLDFFRCKSSDERLRQEYWCERQLDLAYKLHKPIVVHSVRAHDRMISLLKKHHIHSGIIHGFHGNESIGRQYLNLGFKLSVDGQDFAGRNRGQFSWMKLGDFVLESDEPLERSPLPDPKTLARLWVGHLKFPNL